MQIKYVIKFADTIEKQLSLFFQLCITHGGGVRSSLDVVIPSQLSLLQLFCYVVY